MSKLKIERGSGELNISFSWRTPAMWFLLIFCLIWDSVTLLFAFTGAGFFIIFHALAGLFITWWTLTRFTNTTRVTVDRQNLRMEHGPVPWPFSKDKLIPARALVQLYVDKSSVKQNDQSTYRLMAKLDTGAEVKLIDAEPDKQLLLDLERAIETYLDITNDASLDLTAKTGLDLEAMREQMKKLEPIKKWLPKSIRSQMEEAEARMAAEGQRRGTASPAAPRAENWDVTVRTGNGAGTRAPRPLPEPEHDLVFPLYRLRAGETVSYLDRAYRLGRSAQLDWDDDDISLGRQLELVPTAGGTALNFYAQIERNRWAYYEERRLDDDEVATLGFVGETHPLRFENGADRYYPRDQQTGYRFLGGVGQEVEQFIYFTTASSTQFRALRPLGRGWEVYVMEVVDGGRFA